MNLYLNKLVINFIQFNCIESSLPSHAQSCLVMTHRAKWYEDIKPQGVA